MITETETAFLAVVRAFLTEEKAALEELAALTKNNGIICLSSRHSIRCCQRSTMLWAKHRNLQSFRMSFADR